MFERGIDFFVDNDKLTVKSILRILAILLYVCSQYVKDK